MRSHEKLQQCTGRTVCSTSTRDLLSTLARLRVVDPPPPDRRQPCSPSFLTLARHRRLYHHGHSHPIRRISSRPRSAPRPSPPSSDPVPQQHTVERVASRPPPQSFHLEHSLIPCSSRHRIAKASKEVAVEAKWQYIEDLKQHGVAIEQVRLEGGWLVGVGDRRGR